MNVFQKFFQSTQLCAKALLLSLDIARLQLRIRLCNWQLWFSSHDSNTVRNLKDKQFSYQIESQSLRVRVHRVMTARKLKERLAWDKLDEWKG